MRTLITTLSALILFAGGLFATPAHADSEKFIKMINATQKDYECVKAHFRGYRAGGASYEANRRDIETVANRIEARRQSLADYVNQSEKGLPASQRGLFKMLVSDIDQVNLSLLALLKDERGYSGYIRTGDEGLKKGISTWEEGIRQAINESKRCIKMARAATGPYMASHQTPLEAR